MAPHGRSATRAYLRRRPASWSGSKRAAADSTGRTRSPHRCSRPAPPRSATPRPVRRAPSSASTSSPTRAPSTTPANSATTPTCASTRFIAEAGIPYLLAVSPRVSADYLDPAVERDRPLSAGEEARLAELRDDPLVTFALHGLNHRTRHASPRRRSEFTGLSPADAAARIDGAVETLRGLGIEVPAFVPPFNRFGANQYALLAERFEIVCSGPETIRLLGFQPTPMFWGEALYLPSYAPLYEKAAKVLPEVERLRDERAALWAPLTLHWGWELEDGFAALRRLCAVLADGLAADWKDLREAIAEIRRID